MCKYKAGSAPIFLRQALEMSNRLRLGKAQNWRMNMFRSIKNGTALTTPHPKSTGCSTTAIARSALRPASSALSASSAKVKGERCGSKRVGISHFLYDSSNIEATRAVGNALSNRPTQWPTFFITPPPSSTKSFPPRASFNSSLDLCCFLPSIYLSSPQISTQHNSTHNLTLPPLPRKSANMSTKAFVQKPAPTFTATTVLEHGEFKEVSLSDFQGQW